MDDLTMLRDLGRDLESEPPAQLVRQRERIFRRRRRRLGPLTISMAALATAVAIAVPAVLLDLRSAPTATRPAGARPVDVSGTMNVLLVGSDTREGAGNEKYGPATARGDAGQRSDTLMVVHIPEDRGQITVVNIPRDSMVKLSACGGGRVDMINSAYNAGGLACTWETVEARTGVRIDHAVEIDFTGLADMVDALGGVRFTVPRDISDRKAKLELKKGTQVLDGEQALGWVRLRGLGSDLSRIKRQQDFMKAMYHQARQRLSEPARLREFMTAARRSVKTSEGLDLETMYALALSVGGSDVRFVSVPVEPYPKDTNRVQWLATEAKLLFEELK